MWSDALTIVRFVSVQNGKQEEKEAREGKSSCDLIHFHQNEFISIIARVCA